MISTTDHPLPSTTPTALYLALPSARDIAAAPHLVTVELTQAAIAATHAALGAAHPILALAARPGGARRELTDAEHFAALILHVSDHLAVLLHDYVASYDLQPQDHLPPEAPPLR